MKKSMNDEEKFECKEYLFSLPHCHARMFFQHKYSMTENVKMNFKGDTSYARALWKCQNVETRIQKVICYGVQGTLNREKIWILIRTKICADISKKSFSKYVKKIRNETSQTYLAR
jgi:hypothetical protein